ncbi:MAG: hypothetical protein P4M09_22250 [Devosia sp.]|nr:hypothetical protein [Devosia sp.]
MTSSFARASDLLCSGTDGVYDVSFFAASIRHTIERSRSVFGKLSGDSLAQLGGVWRELDEEDRQAFLLEHHEFAHHALMFSTPAGVLNWRINQVISRDVQWVLRKCHEFNVEFPEGKTPQQVVSTRAWQVAFKRRNDVDRGTKQALLHTITALEDLIRLRRILFEPGAARTFADLTFGELLDLLKRSFPYLGMRCDVGLCGDWRTRLPRTTKVFPEGKAFNLVDIAEVHAIAMELFVLRAVGDIDRFHQRVERGRGGPHGVALDVAIQATSEVNELGLSPHQMQMLALIAFSSALDVPAPTTKTIYLEEALPWWRFAAPTLVTTATYMDAVGNSLAIATSPLVGPGSQWLKMAGGDWPLTQLKSLEQFGAFAMSLSSLGLDRQIHAIHQGAILNWRYLLTQLEASFDLPQALKFDRLSGEAWRGEVQSAVLLAEYKDGLHFRYADFAELYPEGSFHRHTVKSLDRYGEPAYQLMGQLLNGAIPRIMYAGYSGRLLPRLHTLEPKLATYFDNPELATNTVHLLQTLIEGAMTVVEPYLTFAPSSLGVDRYI